jgi:hypothetical protein
MDKTKHKRNWVKPQILILKEEKQWIVKYLIFCKSCAYLEIMWSQISGKWWNCIELEKLILGKIVFLC